MKRIGITGENGFIGTHLSNTIGLFGEKYIKIGFKKSFFGSEKLMDEFVSSCDVIIHLAGMNRHNDPQIIYDTNVSLTRILIDSLKRTASRAHLIFSSSSQEEKDNLYGKSKQKSRILLQEWAEHSSGTFTGLIIPNVFGPFGNPYYNSVVATFCYQVTHNIEPKIDIDGELKLIYVGELVNEFLSVVDAGLPNPNLVINHTAVYKVTQLLELIHTYKSEYSDKGIIPAIKNSFELNLFNTYRCYEDIAQKNPVKLIQHIDSRGAFSEIIRHHISGQTSFSTTHPGITRGNHFHTRKIERFTVISGEALIQLRRIGTDEVHNFYLSGDSPSFVDMPIWYTHNIKNIGDKELFTIFWINEPYNPEDPDTYFENV